MTFQDYINQVTDDATQVLREQWGQWDDFDEFVDSLWVDDSVTGNGSGSYTFSTWEAEQYTRDLVWDDEFAEALRDMGMTMDHAIEQGPEGMDVIARCLALGFCHDDLRDAWDELEDEAEEEDEAEAM